MLRNIPNIVVENYNGKKYRFHQLIEGKDVLLNMFYSKCETKCKPLGLLMNNVHKLVHDNPNIIFISISLDSRNDTIQKLNQFRSSIGANHRHWYFLRGHPKQIDALRFRIGMYNSDKHIDDVLSNHSGHFIIFNEKYNRVKHADPFDNCVDIARKVVQLLPESILTNSYIELMERLQYNRVKESTLFENIMTMNSVFTVPYLPVYLKNKYDKYALEQKKTGFHYDPYLKSKCCCSS